MNSASRSRGRRMVLVVGSVAVFMLVVGASAAAPKVRQEQGASSTLTYGSADLQIGWRSIEAQSRGGAMGVVGDGRLIQPAPLRFPKIQDPPPPPPAQSTGLQLSLSMGDWLGSSNPPSANLAWIRSETEESFGLRIFDTSQFPARPPVEVSITCGGACSQSPAGSGYETYISGSRNPAVGEENQRDYCNLAFTRMNPEEVSGTLECQGIPNVQDSSQVIDVFGTFLASQTPQLPRTSGNEEEETTEAQASDASARDRPAIPLTATAGLLALAAAAGAGFVKFSVLAPAVGAINAPSQSADRRKTRRSHASCQTEWSAASLRSHEATEGATGKVESSVESIDRTMVLIVDSLTQTAEAFSELASRSSSETDPGKRDAESVLVGRILKNAAELLNEANKRVN